MLDWSTMPILFKRGLCRREEAFLRLPFEQHLSGSVVDAIW